MTTRDDRLYRNAAVRGRTCTHVIVRFEKSPGSRFQLLRQDPESLADNSSINSSNLGEQALFPSFSAVRHQVPYPRVADHLHDLRACLVHCDEFIRWPERAGLWLAESKPLGSHNTGCSSTAEGESLAGFLPIC